MNQSHLERFMRHLAGSDLETTCDLVSALFVWACLADKPWLKVLLADLV